MALPAPQVRAEIARLLPAPTLTARYGLTTIRDNDDEARDDSKAVDDDAMEVMAVFGPLAASGVGTIEHVEMKMLCGSGIRWQPPQEGSAAAAAAAAAAATAAASATGRARRRRRGQ